MRNKSIFITKTAIIAALYVAMTLPFAPISYGPIQFRISEALTILPLFYFEAVPGLFIGCLIANIASGMVIDVVLGSLATLIAAILTYLSRKIYIGVLPPIIINALVVPLIFLTIPDIQTGYFLNVLTVGAGQILAILGLGVPFYFALKSAIRKTPLLKPTGLKR